MQSFLACFACQNKSNKIIPPKQIPSKSNPPNNLLSVTTLRQQQNIISQQQKTKSFIVTNNQIQTQGLLEIESQINKFIDDLKKKSLLQRKQFQADYVKNNMKISDQMYFIQKKWSDLYTIYLNIAKQPPILNMPQIDNTSLFSQNKVKVGIVEKEDYYFLPKRIWIFVQKLYGGGPQLKKTQYLPIFMIPTFGLKKNEKLDYLNSVVQILFSIGEFAYYFRNKKYIELENKSNKKLFSIYTHNTIKKFLLDRSKDAKNLQEFGEIFLNRFGDNKQNDCFQFIQYYLDMLKQQTNNRIDKSKDMIFNSAQQSIRYYLQYNRSIIDKLFYGQNTAFIKCLKCDNLKVSFQPFLIMKIQIKKKSLQNCLKSYFSQQDLLDLIDCQICNLKTKAIKQITLSKTPPYLIIILKRFSQAKLKNYEPISYPIQLSLQNYCKSKIGGFQYVLNSFLVHKGTFQKGQYHCICRRDKKWFYMKDQKVSEVNIKQYLNEQVYVLIYQKPI